MFGIYSGNGFQKGSFRIKEVSDKNPETIAVHEFIAIVSRFFSSKNILTPIVSGFVKKQQISTPIVSGFTNF